MFLQRTLCASVCDILSAYVRVRVQPANIHVKLRCIGL